MRKIYVRDTGCFAIGAWVTWYQVTHNQDNLIAWVVATCLLAGPGALNILASVLQTRLTNGQSEPSQASSASDVSPQRSLP